MFRQESNGNSIDARTATTYIHGCIKREEIFMTKATVCMTVFLSLTLNAVKAQELVPELAGPAAKYKEAVEALNKQWLTAVAKAGQSYVAALDGIGKSATAKGDIDLVAAVAKEREAAVAGRLEKDLPATLPKMQLQGTRNALRYKLEPISKEFAKRRGTLVTTYLGELASLQAKAAPDSELAKQVESEKTALLGEGGGKEEAKAAKVSRGKNSVVNGNFEKVDAEGKPEGWNWGDWIRVVRETGNTFVRFEEKAINKDGTCGYHAIRQTVEVSQKALRVRIAARIRTVDVVPPTKTAFPGLIITFIDKNGGKHFRVAKWQNKNGAWQDIESEGPIPAECFTAEFAVSSGSCPGQIDFDDVEVTFK